MSTPASSARALHDTFAAVDGGITASHSPYHSWKEVSGYATESSDFARYHAEVMALVGDVVEELQTLEPRQRERYAQYLPAWWAAIVRPRRDWAARATEIIDTPSLHLLAMLADLLESRASLTGTTTPKAPEMHRKAVLLLVDDIEREADLRASVQTQVLADLRHILWLVDHVDTFGVDRVVGAAQKVAGRASYVAVTWRVPALKRVAVAITTVLALAGPTAASMDTVVMHVKHVFGVIGAVPVDDDVQQVVVQVYNACAQKALDLGSDAKVLGTIPSADADGVVVAELVEGGEGP